MLELPAARETSAKISAMTKMLSSDSESSMT